MPVMFCVPSTVTLPAAPWNTAKLLTQPWLRVPSTLVQLVLPAFQVPLPPSIAPLPIRLLPSQNCTVVLGAVTSRLTLLVIAVCTCRSPGTTLPGSVPSARPLSVKAPV
ncbi:hypothetical protein PFLmoz3_04703 [Pseudomonas fluorescens]|uniref:Uncharacterized protein n=1 Tax=Pseudomonas fluorescens TaxID=294 RepID=A0A109LDQ8_PSEFL|nr:hypothetical protein PFLmoz3_04703 [Pseudomonas fluorescens]